MGHQISRMTTITVVICMMRSALPLDSCTPLMLLPPEINGDQHCHARREGIGIDVIGLVQSGR